MTNKQYTLGFIGIGLMGKSLALRLLDAGFKVNIWNRSQEKLKPVTTSGATAFPKTSEMVKSSDIIILCLANSEAVQPESGIIKFEKLFSSMEQSKYAGWTGAEYKPVGKTEESLRCCPVISWTL